ncbi:MAG: triose-phosphate isomerase [Nanoarchaeota archaeon]
MIVINFKNYKTGKSALQLARKIQKYLPRAIICPAMIDIENIVDNTKLSVFAQHVDSKESNRATGYNMLETLKKAGAMGTLINHSEHPISMKDISKVLTVSKKFNLKIIVCASNLNEVRKISKLKPYAIAFEDPKLVGSGKSITQYRTKDVEKFSNLLRKSRIITLCGAGINSADDIREAYKLGCKGVLIASAIANSKKPEILLNNIKGVER